MSVMDRIREVLRDTLQIGPRADNLAEPSRLLGVVPEFDSVAVVLVVAALEDEFRLKIPDRELSAEVFETLGSLTRFVTLKLAPTLPQDSLCA
jgi:acyl carrier protein